MAISKELESIYDGSNILDTTIDTVEIYHPKLNNHLFLTNHYQDLELNTEKGKKIFKSTSFGFKLPPQKKDGIGQFTFTFALFDANILEELNSFANETKIPITIIYRLYSTNMITAPASLNVYHIKAYEISVEDNYISLTGSVLGNLENKIPKLRYSTENYPGLRFI